jgi:hypothetical protein
MSVVELMKPTYTNIISSFPGIEDRAAKAKEENPALQTSASESSSGFAAPPIAPPESKPKRASGGSKAAPKSTARPNIAGAKKKTKGV